MIAKPVLIHKVGDPSVLKIDGENGTTYEIQLALTPINAPDQR
jgi:hypothetical protein